MTEDEMFGWHHWLDGHECEYAPGVGDGQGGLVCCSPWRHKVRHDWATELNLQICMISIKKDSCIFLSFMFATLGWSTWITNSLIDIQEMCKIKYYNPIQSACNTVINLAYITINMELHVWEDAHRHSEGKRGSVLTPKPNTGTG